MKRSYLVLIALLQIALIAFLVLAVTQQKLIWYLAAAGCVTVFSVIAAVLTFQHFFHSE